MAPSPTPIGQRLLKQGAITEEILQAALQRQKEVGGRLGTILFDMGVVSQYTLTNMLNRYHGLPLLRVAEEIHVKPNVVAMFPRNIALQHGVVPINTMGGRFVVGAMNPPAPQAIRDLESAMRKEIYVRIIPEAIFHQIRRDHLKIPTDFFARHVDPAKLTERPFQEGHQQKEPRDLIVFEVAGIALAFKRKKKGSAATRVGDMLIEDGIITQAELSAALARFPGSHVGEALMQAELMDSRVLSLYLSRHFGCATIDPYLPVEIQPDMLKLIHPGTARKFHILPLAIYENNLLLLTPEPENELLLQVASRESGHSVRPVVSPLAYCKQLVERFYPQKVVPAKA